MEVEMDLAKEKDWLPSSSSSPSSTVDWLGGKKLFWPLFWSYTDADSSEDSNSRSGAEETGEEEEEEDYSLDYGSEEPLPSGVGGDWDTHWNEGWDPMQSYYGKVCQVVRSLVCYHSQTTCILGGVKNGQYRNQPLNLSYLNVSKRDRDDGTICPRGTETESEGRQWRENNSVA